jgi:predicted NACHT family NTPase
MGGLDGSWRVSDIAPLTVGQQIDLATRWFRYLDDPPSEASDSQSRRQAADFVAELQSNGAIAQLGGTPLLLTGLIALKLARLQLPRNRFLAYAELAKLLLETHPVSRDRVALAGSPRHELDNFTRETALAALAYAIQAGEEASSLDAIENDRAAHVVCQSLVQQVGWSVQEARQSARSLITLGEEEIGIIVRKSPREIGFFHGIFQEYLAAQHLARLAFEEQVEFVKEGLNKGLAEG